MCHLWGPGPLRGERGLRGGRGRATVLSGSSVLSLRGFVAWGGNLEDPFSAGSFVPLSGHMGESWARILAYGGPERRSATGLGLGSLSRPGSSRVRGRRGMGAWTLGSWESCGRRRVVREAGSDCIGKSFSLFPASGKSLGTRVGPEPTAQGEGRGGGGAGSLRGGSLAGQPLP